jgi:ANTAR domain
VNSSDFPVQLTRGRVDAATALDRLRASVPSPDPLVMMFEQLTSVLLPAVCDAVKVDLFADGAPGGVRFQRSIGNAAGDRTELTAEAPHVADPSMDGASGPFVGPDRVTVRFATHPATRQPCRGFVVCRWDDGYAPTRADAALVQCMVDGVVLRRDRELLADEEQAATDRADNWQRAVQSNRRIGAAIGILLTRRRLTESQAFQELVRVSSITNTKLGVVADTLIRTGRLPATGGRQDTVFRQRARRD